jgi:GDP-4-dehydro-6-deoxy-D-mannose reductase
MTRVLITGADGFVASHLIDLLLEEEPEVEIYGTIRRLSDKRNILHVLDKIHLLEMELTDHKSVQEVINLVAPDKVFHIAAQTFVPASWSAPISTFETNVHGTLHILEALRQSPKDLKGTFVAISGSSEEYGKVYPVECPIKEEQPLRPLSPYGVSKVAADKLGYQYAQSYGMNILVTRAFNMTGPRRAEAFVDSNFAKQIVKIELNNQHVDNNVVTHGNLDSIRDFTDVRDTVRAYWLLSQRKWHGDAINVCSGAGHSMLEVLDKLSAMATKPIGRLEDPSRMRPSDVPILIGDNTKVKMYTNWQPTYSWEESLEDLLEYWRRNI